MNFEKTDDKKSRGVLILKKLMNRKYVIIYVLVIICIVFSFTASNFFTVKNAMIVLRQVATTGVLALSMTFLIISGHNDLSAGSAIALGGVIVAMLMSVRGVPVIPAILITIAIMVVLSSTTGVIVVKGKINAFIGTLGISQILRGVTYLVCNGMPVGNLPDSFNKFGAGFFLGIPLPVYIYVAAIVFAIIFLRKMRLGRHAYAIGGNRIAAGLSGINVDRSVLKLYLIHGIFVGIAGVMLASRVKSGQPGIAVGYEMEAMSASIIGGTSFAGGVGTVYGVVVGTLIMGIINNGLDLMNVSSFYKQIIQGAIIVLAILMDRKRKG